MPTDNQLPSSEEAFGSALPDADQAFGAEPTQQKPEGDSFGGGFADYVFTHTPAGRILSAFGQGASDEWGASSLDVEGDLKNWMNRTGIFKDFVQNHQQLSKFYNEAFLRPWATIANTTGNVLKAGLAGVETAGEEAAGELETEGHSLAKSDYMPSWSPASVAGFGLGAAGEMISGTLHGFLPDVLPSGVEADTLSARSSGTIGEGEEGFFGVRNPTPEQQQARYEAGVTGGTNPPLPLNKAWEMPRALPEATEADQFGNLRGESAQRIKEQQEAENNKTYLPDIDTLARQVDPDTFDKWDRLRQIQDNLRTSIPYLTGKLGESYKGDLEIQGQIARARQSLQDIDTQLRDLIPQTARAKSSVQEMLEGEGKESDAYRDYVQAQAFENYFNAVQEVEPQVQQAYTHANNLLDNTNKEIPAQEPVTESTNVTSSSTKTGSNGTLTPVEGTGVTKTRGLSVSLESSAIEKGLTDNFSELPEYNQVNVKDQAAKASDLVNKDYETAKSIAMGNKNPPKGILPESVLMAVRDRALANGDVETIRQLATNSRLATEATTMGQRIRMLAEKDNTDPISAIQSVQKAREKYLKTKGVDVETQKAQTIQDIKDNIEKASNGDEPDKWSDFIKSIECDY